MKKLLYISASSKPESMSTSKTAGRDFVNKFFNKNSDYQLIELDLYNEDIPDVNFRYFTGRAELASGAAYDALSEQDKKIVDRINFLCDQFLSADTYVISAPMWSVSFPAILKRYIDCVILNNKLIKITEEEVTGLLDDKLRKMVYIQSSGGDYPKVLSFKFNHGVSYLHDIFKFLGIKDFEKILVEGVDMTDIGREKALEKAYKDIDDLIEKI
jgi:FMN-dependent NADH-azoreductase